MIDFNINAIEARSDHAAAWTQMEADGCGGGDMAAIVASLLAEECFTIGAALDTVAYALWEVFAAWGVDSAHPFYSFSTTAFLLGFADEPLPEFLSAHHRQWCAGGEARGAFEAMLDSDDAEVQR